MVTGANQSEPLGDGTSVGEEPANSRGITTPLFFVFLANLRRLTLSYGSMSSAVML